MTFALTGFKAFGIECEGATRKWGRQRALLYITAAATDVDLDLGDDTPGTFWTAALANATYGALASQAQDTLQNISAQVNGLMGFKCKQFLVRVQVAALSTTGQYCVVDVTNDRPNITMTASDGETSYIIELEWDLSDNSQPVVSDLGAAQ